jgi:hypothetical protein
MEPQPIAGNGAAESSRLHIHQQRLHSPISGRIQQNPASSISPSSGRIQPGNGAAANRWSRSHLLGTLVPVQVPIFYNVKIAILHTAFMAS